MMPMGSVNPFDLEIDAAGTRLFVSQDFSNNVGVYDIGGGGGLTPVAGGPFAAVTAEHGAVLSPDGAFYYVANLATSISGYSVGGGGALTPIAGSPFLYPASDLAMTPDGDFLLAANYATNRLAVFAVNSLTGVPTPVAGSPFATDTIAPGGVASAFGYVFVANGFFNTGANTVSVYRINSVSGALTPVVGSPFARGVASAATGIVFTLGGVCGNGTVEAGEDCDDGNTEQRRLLLGDLHLRAQRQLVRRRDRVQRRRDLRRRRPLPGGDAARVRRRRRVHAGLLRRRPRLRQRRYALTAGCLAAAKSLLLMKQKSGGAKDKLLWKWIKGAAVSPAQIADPTASSDYALCVYAGGALVAGAELPAGARWSVATSGYQYARSRRLVRRHPEGAAEERRRRQDQGLGEREGQQPARSRARLAGPPSHRAAGEHVLGLLRRRHLRGGRRREQQQRPVQGEDAVRS